MSALADVLAQAVTPGVTVPPQREALEKFREYRRVCRELTDEQIAATANALLAWASARGRPHAEVARELCARWDLADLAERNAGP